MCTTRFSFTNIYTDYIYFYIIKYVIKYVSNRIKIIFADGTDILM